MSQSTRNRQVANVNDFLVWRDEAQVVLTPPTTYVTLPTDPGGSALTTILTYTFTLYEISHIKAIATSRGYASMAGAGNAEFYAEFTMDAAVPTEHPGIISSYLNAAGTFGAVPIPFIAYKWTALAAGAHTLLYKCAEDLQTTRVRRIYYPVMLIEVSRS